MSGGHAHADVMVQAGITPPSRLPVLMTALVGAGGRVLDPTQRQGLHPLVIPLVQESDGPIIGLLRWPTPEPGTPMPLVRHKQDRPWTLDMVAVSADAHLHRHLAIREARGETLPTALIDAVNVPGDLYFSGQLASTGLPLKAYLLLRVGVTHGFFEELIQAHMAKGDHTAAAVTADRACRQDHGWARPWVFRAHLLERLGQHDEARDTARLALAEPIWTFGHDFGPLATLAGWNKVTSIAYRKLADNPDKPPADRAAHTMDATAIDGGDWDAIRPRLADLYTQAELPGVAALVAGSGG